MCFTSTGRIEVLAATIAAAVHVLPFRIRGGGIEQPPPFLRRQRSTDWPVTLWKVVDVIGDRPPSAAELQHP
jgi:hypothetical protein